LHLSKETTRIKHNLSEPTGFLPSPTGEKRVCPRPANKFQKTLRRDLRSIQQRDKIPHFTGNQNALMKTLPPLIRKSKISVHKKLAGGLVVNPPVIFFVRFCGRMGES
jgi:hypothetical protein